MAVKRKKEEKITEKSLEVPSFEEELTKVSEPTLEAKESKDELKYEEIQKIREKIEKTDLGDSLKIQVTAQARSIKLLDGEKKIKKLIELAKLKGVVYAIHVAKKIDDPYVLDILHDTFAKEGYYKKFTK